MIRNPRPHMTWLILLLTILVYSMGNPEELVLWPVAHSDFHWWQLVTYPLTHANWLHLVVNMLALLSFGPALERAWGKWLFVACYIACAVAGGAIQAFLVDTPVVGASGALFGLFAAYAMSNPRRKIVSIFAVPLPAWVVVVLYVGLSGLAWGMHWMVGLAHAAHIGGAVMGVLCCYLAGTKR